MRTEPPPPGTQVVIDLTGTGSDSLARLIGPGISLLRADVVGSSGGELSLAMRVVTDRRGIDTYWSGEVVQVRPQFVERIQERKLSRTRSVLAAAGIVVSLFIASDALTGWAGVFGSRRPSPPSSG